MCMGKKGPGMSHQTLYSPFPEREPFDRFAVVLCGSYRRDPEGLAKIFEILNRDYEVLSPDGLDFVDPEADFVRLPFEMDEEVVAIEERHLSAIAASDFVWLHAPEGYVGTSAALEIGYAKALGIPVFTDTIPVDETLAAMIHLVEEPARAEEVLQPDPGAGLVALQIYYDRMVERRGWDDETAKDALLLLTEEIGELARAIRKTEGLARSGGYDGVDVGEELADVQLYIIHLANILGIDLASAVTVKEAVNAERARNNLPEVED